MVDYDDYSNITFTPSREEDAIDHDSKVILKAIRDIGWVTSVKNVAAGNTLIIDFSLADEEPGVIEAAKGGIFGSSILYEKRDNKVTRATFRLGKIDTEGFMDEKHAETQFQVEVDKLNPPGENYRAHAGDFGQGVKHVDLNGVDDIAELIRFMNDLVALKGSFE